jgi:hypothetical protein
MELIGYRQIKAGDKIFSQQWPIPYPNPDISDIIGKNVWIFKNSSWGYDAPQWVLYYDNNDFSNFDDSYSLIGPVYSNSVPINNGPAFDKDGDGYYWWGLGPKPSNVPSWSIEEDCDDSNSDVGPYDLNPASGHFKYECKNNCDQTITSEDYATPLC